MITSSTNQANIENQVQINGLDWIILIFQNPNKSQTPNIHLRTRVFLNNLWTDIRIRIRPVKEFTITYLALYFGWIGLESVIL